LKTRGVPTERMPAGDGFPESLYFVYNGKKVRLSAYMNAPKNVIYFPDKSSLKRYVAKNAGFWKPGGSMFIVVPDQLAVYLAYHSYSNTACTFPKRQVVMQDVLENAL
jgi:hypothetical protein